MIDQSANTTAKPLSDDELIAAIEREEGESYGYYNGTLSEERQQALEYYFGQEFPDDQYLPEGRSRVVDRSVSDVVESVLPQLLKIFTSGDEVAKFTPSEPNDIAAAEQETAFVNHVVMNQNPGFCILYDTFKDALIQKMGYIKACYEEREDVTKERYEGLTDQEFQMLLADDGIEAIEHEERVSVEVVVGPMGQMQQEVREHDLTIRKTEKCGRVVLESVPPEEIFVSMAHRYVSLADASFVEHRTQKTISAIREMGFDIADDIADDNSSDNSESITRDKYEESEDDNERIGPQRLVWLRDVYIRIDRDGDGIAELRRVLMVGKTILSDEETDIIPIAAFCPMPMPHRHVGQSYADYCMDIQEIKSDLFRLTLDNGYLATNGRFAISDRVNLQDMLQSRPGGVVRVEGEPGSAIMPLVQPSTAGNGLQLLEYTDAVKERRTGVTAYNQGLDANSLNKTASGINQIMSAAQERVLLVARNFAEQLKDLFYIVHHQLLTHERAEKIMELRGQWIPVNPREWKKRTDMQITVGLGTGSKDQQLGHLSNLFQMAMNVAQMGVVTPQNIYEIMKAIAVNAGFKDADRFVTDPSQRPPQQPQQNPMVEVEMAKAQGQMQIEQFKARADLQQEQVRSQNDVAIEREKIAAQMELERYKADLKAKTELEIAMLDRGIQQMQQVQM
jgi:hypothetical protein